MVVCYNDRSQSIKGLAVSSSQLEHLFWAEDSASLCWLDIINILLIPSFWSKVKKSDLHAVKNIGHHNEHSVKDFSIHAKP